MMPPPPPAPNPGDPRRRTLSFAAQEVRLISALVVLLAIGLFMALPFVLSIGAVVFLPLVAALILTIILSPLADWLSVRGLPPVLAALLAMLGMLVVLGLALTVVLQPAASLFEQAPAMVAQIGQHVASLKGSFAWIAQFNRQLTGIFGAGEVREVVLAGPSVLEQLALATPTVLLEVLLTVMLAFFMIEARVRLRRRLLAERGAPAGASQRAARALRDVQDRVASYIFTVGLINLGVGLVVAAGAWALGMKAPLMWGGLAALLNFVPYLGPLLMIGLLALFGLGTAPAILPGLLPAAAYLGLHTVEANVITPAILGARFTMNPVLILLALAYFGWIWGVAGALLSVPILLTLTALVDHLGRPNLIGFLFGEPLFATDVLALREEG